jgi:hypothetical protein
MYYSDFSHSVLQKAKYTFDGFRTYSDLILIEVDFKLKSKKRM